LHDWETHLAQVRYFAELLSYLVLILFAAQNRQKICGCGSAVHDPKRICPFGNQNEKEFVLCLYKHIILRITLLPPDDIPPALFSQMTTCQTAANEFLRQFWLCMYPPVAEQPVLAQATPAQKVAKAAKMVGYLGKTPEKVNALVQTAQVEGIDASRVEIVRAIPLLGDLRT
jgi:hypothetical protein